LRLNFLKNKTRQTGREFWFGAFCFGVIWSLNIQQAWVLTLPVTMLDPNRAAANSENSCEFKSGQRHTSNSVILV
jgi:hypothetical protein